MLGSIRRRRAAAGRSPGVGSAVARRCGAGRGEAAPPRAVSGVAPLTCGRCWEARRCTRAVGAAFRPAVRSPAFLSRRTWGCSVWEPALAAAICSVFAFVSDTQGKARCCAAVVILLLLLEPLSEGARAGPAVPLTRSRSAALGSCYRASRPAKSHQ